MGQDIPVKVKIAAVDKLSKVIDKVKGKFPELTRGVSRTNTMFGIMEQTTAKFQKTLDKVSSGLSDTGKKFAIGFTAPVVAAAGYSVKKFMDIDDAMAEVRASTNLSNEDLKLFTDRMGQLSRKMPVSQQELLAIAAAAGEAGVRGTKDLETFSVAMAKIAKTANIAGPEAAESLARILKLTNEGPASAEQFGSAITALGDKFGVPTKKLLNLTDEIVQETAKFGIGSKQAAVFAAALEPLGVKGREAGTFLGQAFGGIEDAIKKGGIQMKGLTAITGMTADELKTQFGKDPAVIFGKFLEGLDRVKQNGGVAGDALKFFGISGDKAETAMLGLASTQGKMNDMLATAKEAYSSNTALTEEFGDATGNFKSKLSLLKNNVDVLSVSLGARLVPALEVFANILMGVVNFLDAHPWIATMIAYFAGLLAVIGPTLLLFANLVKGVQAAVVVFNVLTAVMAGFGTVSWVALLPLIILIAKIVLIGAVIGGLVYLIWKFRQAIMDGIVYAWEAVIETITFAISKLGEAYNAVKKFLGFGNPEVNATVNQTKSLERPFTPQGASVGGLEMQSKMNPEFSTQTNNARVDINVRAPQSTTIVGESAGDFLSINRGLVGAF